MNGSIDRYIDRRRERERYIYIYAYKNNLLFPDRSPVTRVSSLSSGKVCPPPLPRQDHQHYRETGLSRHALFESHCAEPSNKLAPDPITLSGTKSCLLTPRHYPKDFGIALASLIAQQVPSGDLRNKRNVDPALTDREIFDSLKIGDVWWDAGLPDLYWYLRKLPSLKIPSSWESTIEAFETELLSVSCFQFYDLYIFWNQQARAK